MTILLGLALLASGTTGFVESGEDYDTAVRHLRACITGGAGGAAGLLAASVQAIRALCGHQIRVVQTIEEHRIEQQNPQPQTPADKERLTRLKREAAIHLNNEIARLVATLTGKTE